MRFSWLWNHQHSHMCDRSFFNCTLAIAREWTKLTMQLNVTLLLLLLFVIHFYCFSACEHTIASVECWNKTWSHTCSLHSITNGEKKEKNHGTEHFSCASWLLTYSMHFLSIRLLVYVCACTCVCVFVYVNFIFLFFIPVCCKTTHFKCRLCAITQKVQFIHSSLSKYMLGRERERDIECSQPR